MYIYTNIEQQVALGLDKKGSFAAWNSPKSSVYVRGGVTWGGDVGVVWGGCVGVRGVGGCGVWVWVCVCADVCSNLDVE